MALGSKLFLSVAVAGLFYYAPAPAAEVTIKGAGCFPIGSPPISGFVNYVKEVNKRGKGILQIKLVGGAFFSSSSLIIFRRVNPFVQFLHICISASYT